MRTRSALRRVQTPQWHWDAAQRSWREGLRCCSERLQCVQHPEIHWIELTLIVRKLVWCSSDAFAYGEGRLYLLRLQSALSHSRDTRSMHPSEMKKLHPVCSHTDKGSLWITLVGVVLITIRIQVRCIMRS